MRLLISIAAALLLVKPGAAEVVTSSGQGFDLRHEAVSPLEASALWERLMEPSLWWADDHTYSRSAANISPLGDAGSVWREDWATGSVIHGRVLLVQEQQQLVLSAPFGPLLSTGAECIWTIKLEPLPSGGTRISSSHTVVGREGTGLEDLAAAVDFVMAAGIESLAQPQ